MSDVVDGLDRPAFFLNLARTGGDVVAFGRGGRRAYLVNHLGLVERVLGDDDAAYQNPYHPYAELSYRPAGRFLLQRSPGPADRAAYLQAMPAAFGEVAGEAVPTWAAPARGGPVDVCVEGKKLALRAMSRILFGIEPAGGASAFVEAASFLEECQASGALPGPGAPPALVARHRAAVSVEERGVAGIAAALYTGARAHDARIHDAILRTLLNGYNAVATAFAWTMHLLARAEDVQREVRREIAETLPGWPPEHAGILALRRLRAAVLESARLYPPAWLYGRQALRGHPLGGALVEPGAALYVCSYAIHRDRRYWTRPDEFLPERFGGASTRSEARAPLAYLPFGAGPRRCPAAHATVGQVMWLVAAVLHRHRVAPGSADPVRPRGLISLRPHPGVLLQVIPSGP